MSRSIILHVEGMSCGACVSRVEQALKDTAGVEDAAVNLTAETASITVTNDLAPRTLVDAVRNAGYDATVVHTPIRHRTTLEKAHEDRMREQRQAFVHALATGVPIIALHGFSHLLMSPDKGGHVWPVAIQAILCTVLLFSAAGAPIIVGGVRAVAHRTANMDVLVSIGVIVAYVAGVTSLLAAARHPPHFHAAAMILMFINLGRYIELRARRDAAAAASGIAGQLPTEVTLVDGDQLRKKKLEDVVVGDVLRVAQGAVIPVDGIVREGEAAVDQSTMTGEPIPVSVGGNAEVTSGSTVVEGLLTIETLRTGRDAAIGRIQQAVEQAQGGKTHMQRVADRIAGVFVPIVLALAVVTVAGNLLAGIATAEAISRTVAVLVIACPCAMGLATPTAIMVAAANAARQGILIKDAAAWESTASVTTVLFDKTGTLTAGHPTVSVAYDEPVSPITTTEDEIIQWAASAEQHAQHPIARAIVEAARTRNLKLTSPEAFTSVPGQGCTATIDGREIVVGSRSLFEEKGISLERLATRSEQLISDGQSVVYLGIDGECAGLLSVTDRIRDDVANAVSALRDLGVTPVIVTGDRTGPATTLASAAGIQHVEAELSPEQKLAAVHGRQQKLEKVAVVGDGINDAPALAAADVGITFSEAADLATSAAHLTLLHHNLMAIPNAIGLARRTVTIIKQNLAWAFAYNVAALPAAAFGFVHPGFAAAAMMFSSISVILNSLRLRRPVQPANEAPD